MQLQIYHVGPPVSVLRTSHTSVGPAQSLTGKKQKMFSAKLKRQMARRARLFSHRTEKVNSICHLSIFSGTNISIIGNKDLVGTTIELHWFYTNVVKPSWSLAPKRECRNVNKRLKMRAPKRKGMGEGERGDPAC